MRLLAVFCRELGNEGTQNDGIVSHPVAGLRIFGSEWKKDRVVSSVML
mgnify:CR=1 FL=1